MIIIMIARKYDSYHVNVNDGLGEF